MSYIFFNFHSVTNIKVGFSEFCMLHSKWCVDFVCKAQFVFVGTVHQNVEPLLQASCIEGTYKRFIQQLMCSAETKNCVVAVAL